MKKIFYVILTIFLIVLMSVPVLADTFSPRYIISCPSGEKHNMTAKGFADAYAGPYNNSGSVILKSSPMSQCSKCNLVLISELDHLTGIVGKFTLLNWPGVIYSSYTKAYGCVFDTFYGVLQEDSFWAGFEFRGGTG